MQTSYLVTYRNPIITGLANDPVPQSLTESSDATKPGCNEDDLIAMQRQFEVLGGSLAQQVLELEQALKATRNERRVVAKKVEGLSTLLAEIHSLRSHTPGEDIRSSAIPEASDAAVDQLDNDAPPRIRVVKHIWFYACVAAVIIAVAWFNSANGSHDDRGLLGWYASAKGVLMQTLQLGHLARRGPSDGQP